VLPLENSKHRKAGAAAKKSISSLPHNNFVSHKDCNFPPQIGAPIDSDHSTAQALSVGLFRLTFREVKDEKYDRTCVRVNVE
jgi:hypothetical protein